MSKRIKKLIIALLVLAGITIVLIITIFILAVASIAEGISEGIRVNDRFTSIGQELKQDKSKSESSEWLEFEYNNSYYSSWYNDYNLNVEEAENFIVSQNYYSFDEIYKDYANGSLSDSQIKMVEAYILENNDIKYFILKYDEESVWTLYENAMLGKLEEKDANYILITLNEIIRDPYNRVIQKNQE